MSIWVADIWIFKARYNFFTVEAFKKISKSKQIKFYFFRQFYFFHDAETFQNLNSIGAFRVVIVDVSADDFSQRLSVAGDRLFDELSVVEDTWNPIGSVDNGSCDKDIILVLAGLWVL